MSSFCGYRIMDSRNRLGWKSPKGSPVSKLPLTSRVLHPHDPHEVVLDLETGKFTRGRNSQLTQNIKTKNPDVTEVCYLAQPAKSNGEALGASPILAPGSVKTC